MKTVTFKSEEEWKNARLGKVTGTKLGSLYSKRDGKPLKGFWELAAERIALPETEENAMDRGKRLESYGIARFAEETGKKVDGTLLMWERDDNPDIAVSPDGVIGKTEAVEVKCRNSASHIEAIVTGKIPSEYEMQVLQYFIVNETLKTLYFVFYDPRVPKDLVWFEVKRKDKEKDIAKYLELERKALEEIAKIEKQLTF